MNDAKHKAYADAGVEKYIYIAISDSKTCKSCFGLNRKIFLVSEAIAGVNRAPMHPHCRCTDAPVIDKEAVKSMKMNSEPFKADMTYSEWKSKYVVAGKEP